MPGKAKKARNGNAGGNDALVKPKERVLKKPEGKKMGVMKVVKKAKSIAKEVVEKALKDKVNTKRQTRKKGHQRQKRTAMRKTKRERRLRHGIM